MNTDIEINANEEYSLPCAEALMAGTLALMTGHVQACCDGHREQMAQKIVTNLAALAQHPLLSAPFQTMLWNLRTRWQLKIEQQDASQLVQPNEQDQRLWHTGPVVVQ